MAVTIFSAQVVGLEAKIISVEVDISPGLHIFSIVGLADKEIQESRERISAAIKNIGALAPHKKSQRVIVNLAPADIKKEGPAFDLPIAIGYLLASGQLKFNPEEKVFLGELGLDGNLRKITGALPAALAAQKSGFKTVILPSGSGREAALAGEIEIVESGSLAETAEYLSGAKKLAVLPQTKIANASGKKFLLDFKNIKGQSSAKRALEVAAAGGHNVLMSGPPGTGKTMLAQALPSILPALSFEEMLEVTKIYSVAGLLDDENPFMSERPFRSPHHTSSHTAVIGGGSVPHPGEITLAHRGVLFLDEFPEFDRRVIESLRQPLETRRVTIARTGGVQTFPANFILVAAMNPCPCGNYGSLRKDCACSPGAILKYKKKISGPMLDRMDMHIEVPHIEYEKLESGEEEEPSEKIREKIVRSRMMQRERFKKNPASVNAEMSAEEIKSFIAIKSGLRPMLKFAHEKHRLSARAYHRMLKLARTIADLEESEDVEEKHVLEALQYRPKIEL